jgi:hypothetical protein
LKTADGKRIHGVDTHLLDRVVSEAYEKRKEVDNFELYKY